MGRLVQQAPQSVCRNAVRSPLRGGATGAVGLMTATMVLGLLLNGPLLSEQTSPATAAGENLAKGRPYKVQPRPTYRYCTDPQDNRQLTDGFYTKDYFWTQKSTVGWQHAKPVVVTIDLGQIQPIRGVSYNTAAGVAGVEWPKAVYILVSDDGKEFYEAGELVCLSARRGLPPRKGYGVHRYQTQELRTHGRYVSLVIVNQPYIFADEIEVYRGKPAWLQLPRPGEPVVDAQAFYAKHAVRQGVTLRLLSDARLIKELVKQAKIPDQAQKRLLTTLAQIETEIPEMAHQDDPGFRAILPLNALHRRIFQVQGQLWQNLGRVPLTVWPARPWDPLALDTIPPAGTQVSVDVMMMNNEYRAGAFNVSAAGDADYVLRLGIEGMPGGRTPNYVTVHEVAWTDTSSGQPVAAALPQARREGGEFLIHVPAGLTRQVWLTFHPTDLAPGTHQGRIALEHAGHTISVPLRLSIARQRFPDQPTLHLGGWDYTNGKGLYGVTPENRDLLIEHLRQHYVDSPWATAAVLTRGRFDDTGKMIEAPDTAVFDEWLGRWQGARQYCVFASVPGHFAGTPINTPAFARKVAAWIRFWANHVTKRGLRPEQLVVLLVDEPHDAKQDEVIIAWAKVIAEQKTGITLFEDPTYRDPRQAKAQMMDLAAVLCPNRPMFLTSSQAFRDFYIERGRGRNQLAFYSCSGPSRLLDPYEYYRLQAWSCWQYGGNGSYFWAFGDTGGCSCWNEYLAERNGYTPFFLDARSVTPGKQFEAVREGIQDYQYLVMLRDAVSRTAELNVDSETLARARQLLAGAADRVCNTKTATAFSWHQDKDRTVADRVRREILEMLAAFSQK